MGQVCLLVMQLFFGECILPCTFTDFQAHFVVTFEVASAAGPVYGAVGKELQVKGKIKKFIH